MGDVEILVVIMGLIMMGALITGAITRHKVSIIMLLSSIKPSWSGFRKLLRDLIGGFVFQIALAVSVLAIVYSTSEDIRNLVKIEGYFFTNLTVMLIFFMNYFYLESKHSVDQIEKYLDSVLLSVKSYAEECKKRELIKSEGLDSNDSLAIEGLDGLINCAEEMEHHLIYEVHRKTCKMNKTIIKTKIKSLLSSIDIDLESTNFTNSNLLFLMKWLKKN